MLDLVLTILMILLVPLGIFLVGIILLQESKSGGLSGAFGGGGAGETLLGARAGRELSRMTTYGSIAFMAILLVIGILCNVKQRESFVLPAKDGEETAVEAKEEGGAAAEEGAAKEGEKAGETTAEEGKAGTEAAAEGKKALETTPAAEEGKAAETTPPAGEPEATDEPSPPAEEEKAAETTPPAGEPEATGTPPPAEGKAAESETQDPGTVEGAEPKGEPGP